MARGLDFIGPYRMARLIRSGHACQVWECIHEQDQTRVALKVLHREHAKNAAEKASLKHEFEVGSTLKHPNVIQLMRYTADYDLPFLVLELFYARNLKQFIRQDHPKVLFLAPQIIEGAAAGLGHLHDKGWIHRDVKPDNFLVDDEGLVKLIDFAIAQRPPRGLGKLFGGAKIQGTRSYMSPEQIRGQALDQRADIYSFGCVLYELLAGKPPFTGENANELLNKHVRAAIPNVMAGNDNVSPEFAALIARMMAKKPEDRPPALRDFLREYKAMRPFRSRPKPPAQAK